MGSDFEDLCVKVARQIEGGSPYRIRHGDFSEKDFLAISGWLGMQKRAHLDW